MLAAVVAVGTELTSGQIINKNASWISESLKELGVSTSNHVVVPDDRPLILDALKFCAERCDTLFVTGGLGPTTDDFTRELISAWSGQPLEFHEPSWLHIKERLGSRAIEIRETQRQQCLYPKGSIVIENPEGTANAFQLKVGKVDVFVLPGPPREIEAVWKNGIDAFLRDKARNIDKAVTYSWDTMGLGESDVSFMTENCLTGVDIEKGYRVHMPYVEVKLSFMESQRAQMMPYVAKVEQALQAITITRNGEDVPQLLAQQLAEIAKIVVVDSCTGTAVLERLSPALRRWMRDKSWSFGSEDILADPLTLKLVLKPLDASRATGEIHYKGAVFKDVFEAPMFVSRVSDRKSLYFAERAMIFWHKMLQNLN
jgi:nicotinamide-nucleotide amidase